MIHLRLFCTQELGLLIIVRTILLLDTVAEKVNIETMNKGIYSFRAGLYKTTKSQRQQNTGVSNSHCLITWAHQVLHVQTVKLFSSKNVRFVTFQIAKNSSILLFFSHFLHIFTCLLKKISMKQLLKS